MVDGMMNVLKNFLDILVPGSFGKGDDPSLTVAFRYQRFQSLLTANNNALQAMAELEKLYYSGRSYRMADIRARILTVLVNIYKMIDNLNEMSAGRYKELDKVYDKIKNEIDTILLSKPQIVDGPLVVTLEQTGLSDSQLVGQKMAVLGELARQNLYRVPPGFVMTASATRRFLTAEFLTEVNRKLQILDPDDIGELYQTCDDFQRMVMELEVPPELLDEMYAHYKRIEDAWGQGVTVAIRSSAIGEDTAGISFAGLYESILFVKKEDLENGYKQVVASKYGARAIAYRRKRGFRHEDVEMCVGFLAMVDAACGGVVYSAYPASDESLCVRINSVKGVARGVVDGTVVTQSYQVDRTPPFSIINDAAGMPAAEKQNRVLSEEEINRLTRTALSLEHYFDDEPQDIEWAFDRQNELYILQSRPFEYKSAALLQPEESNDAEGNVNIDGAEVLIQGGTCVSRGIACGTVYKMGRPETAVTLPENAVLVIDYPLPEWAPWLDKAAALLAGHGSEAGHLATVSREFGLPAIFGLQDRLETLENGAEVTVDSEATTVWAGIHQDVIRKKKPRRDIMAGSPVQHIVTEALQYITPLNLNDPSSYQFKPSWCETLHDITRFCHEKSVAEMFKAGESATFDNNKAKRLVGNVALEWWVINLADGFSEGAGSVKQTIRIDDIESIPMLAIWSGITAVPWGGPPPISAKGFGSIILQSAMRPDLEPAVASRLTAKNYFLISKNFCNLSVRLGYHYAMIEAYLGDLLNENYVTFRFKGGAADLRRKSLRARLLAEILEKYNFNVQLRSDALLARIKKESQEYLEQRLKILGYLTLHARQLDMVMSRKDAIAHYKNIFCKDIDKMLQ